MKKLMMIALPVAILTFGVAGAVAIVESRPEPEARVPEVVPPLVRVHEVRLQDVRLTVASQGTVSPRTESVLVPEVAGRVVEVSASFAAGGFFEAGEALLRIDPQGYRDAIVRAEAEVARARLAQVREQAEAEVALRQWQELGKGEPPPLIRHEPQLAEARATLAAAEAALTAARRDLDRTVVRAPYAGRIRSKSADVGQVVAPGSTLATIYAVDYAEIRLPIPDHELAYLDLSLHFQSSDGDGPEVILRSDFAGRRHEWRGEIVRTEGEIDPRSRLVHAVARVEDPYGAREEPGRPPLAVGLYVDAEILGRTVHEVAILPRSALREAKGADTSHGIRAQTTVLVIDGDDRLQPKAVEVLRRSQGSAIVGSGLENGERVCLSQIESVTDGMKVRTREGSS